MGTLAKKYEVRHFILWAGEDTLKKRLASRLERPGSWGHRQIGRCLRAFETQVTEEKVDTDGLGIGQAAEKIGALCGLALAEDRRGPVRRGLGRLATQIRHIR